MFIELAFVIVKAWKQPKYPTIGTHLDELWHIQTMRTDTFKSHVLAFSDGKM